MKAIVFFNDSLHLSNQHTARPAVKKHNPKAVTKTVNRGQRKVNRTFVVSLISPVRAAAHFRPCRELRVVTSNAFVVF